MITDKDREFARDLVRLARKHGCGKLRVDFTLNSAKSFRDGHLRYDDVKMVWEEGRHGAKTNIALSASVYFQEREPEPESEPGEAA